MSRIRMFPGIIFGLLGINFTVVGVTVYYAYSDTAHAVEPNYDLKAEAWNETSLQNQRNERLGWAAAVETQPEHHRVLVRLVDDEGNPVADAALTGFAFRSIRASRRFDLAFTQTQPGVYQAPLRLNERGIWEFRLSAERGIERFTASAQAELLLQPPPETAR